MDTVNDELVRRIMRGYSMLAPSMRDVVAWRMNLDTFNELLKYASPYGRMMVDTKGLVFGKIPEGSRALDIPIEEHTSDEILLVMKVL